MNGYKNTELEGLVTRSMTVNDENELKSVFSQIQMKIVDELPFMGLLFRTGVVFSTRSLAGLNGIRAYNALNGIEFLEP